MTAMTISMCLQIVQSYKDNNEHVVSGHGHQTQSTIGDIYKMIRFHTFRSIITGPAYTVVSGIKLIVLFPVNRRYLKSFHSLVIQFYYQSEL